MPKRTYQPSKIKRVRSHGFRTRLKSRGGREVLKSRRSKKRWELTVSDEFRQSKNKKFKRLR